MKDCNGTCIATTDCCGGCGTGKKCSNGTCVAACTANSCSGYSLSSCPANGNCSSCSVVNSDCSSGGTKYKLDSCASGYSMSGNSCVKLTCTATSCDGYTLTSAPSGGNYSSCFVINSDCTTGGTKYKCNSGYLHNTIDNTCDKRPVFEKPTGPSCDLKTRMWTTCNGNKCCCPKTTGCGTGLGTQCYCLATVANPVKDTPSQSCPGGGRGSSCACGGMHSGIGFAGAHYCTGTR